jgi:hypothetical protein
MERAKGETTMAQKNSKGQTKYPKGVVSWQEQLKPLRNLVNAIQAMDELKTKHKPGTVTLLKKEAVAAIAELKTKEVKVPGRLAGRIAQYVK